MRRAAILGAFAIALACGCGEGVAASTRSHAALNGTGATTVRGRDGSPLWKIGAEGRIVVVSKGDREVALLGASSADELDLDTDRATFCEMKFTTRGLAVRWEGDSITVAGTKHALERPGSNGIDATGKLVSAPK